MIQNAYSIKDAKANVFSAPFFSINDQVALRSFQQAQNDPNTTINQNPQDFSLYRLATFDDQSGELHPEKQPYYLSTASTALDKEEIPTFTEYVES
jgi:hypothetical protein